MNVYGAPIEWPHLTFEPWHSLKPDKILIPLDVCYVQTHSHRMIFENILKRLKLSM